MNKQLIKWGEESGFSGQSINEMIASLKVSNERIKQTKTEEKVFTAENLYKLRRKRDRLFIPGLFSDPAWDLLLDLYVSEKARKKICTTSACIAAGVPASTGLRWINILVQNGYLQREEDPGDARRSLVSLTATARHALETLFEDSGEARD